MTAEPIRTNPGEVSGLVPIARHERDDHLNLTRKKKKKQRKQKDSSVPTDDVEDLMDHSLDDLIEDRDKPLVLAPEENNDDQPQLDLLI